VTNKTNRIVLDARRLMKGGCAVSREREERDWERGKGRGRSEHKGLTSCRGEDGTCESPRVHLVETPRGGRAQPTVETGRRTRSDPKADFLHGLGRKGGKLGGRDLIEKVARSTPHVASREEQRETAQNWD